MRGQIRFWRERWVVILAAVLCLAALIYACGTSRSGDPSALVEVGNAAIASPAPSPSATAMPATPFPAPIFFEKNEGQSDPRVRYLARSGRAVIFITDDAAWVVLHGAQQGVAMKMRFGAGSMAPPSITAGIPLPGKSNYFIGSDPGRWVTDVPQFGAVTLHDVSPGVDLRFHGSRSRELEYDLRLAPGVDPEVIALHFEGAPAASVDTAGNAEISAVEGNLIQPKPIAWQETASGGRDPVECAFTVSSSGTLGFAVGPHDASRGIVIDPSLIYTTTYGGVALASSPANGIVVASDGTVYISGTTNDASFPATTGVFDSQLGGTQDAFILHADGSAAPLAATYLGGSGSDSGSAIAMDAAGNIYLVGETSSSDFPTAHAPSGYSCHTNKDAFVTRIVPSLNLLSYSICIGGASNDSGEGVSVDSSQDVYVTGYEQSSPFLGQTRTGTQDAFVVKLHWPGGLNALTQSFVTLLGGSNGATDGHAIHVDANKKSYVVGETTSSSGFSRLYAQQGTYLGATDGFLTKLGTSGSIDYQSYLGGSGTDRARGIRAISGEVVFVTGETNSTNFYTGVLTPGLFGTRGGTDAFVLKTNTIPHTTIRGTSPPIAIFADYLAGSANDYGNAITADAAGNSFVAGTTFSTNFPLVRDVQSSNPSGTAQFLAMVNAAGSAQTYSSVFLSEIFAPDLG